MIYNSTSRLSYKFAMKYSRGSSALVLFSAFAPARAFTNLSTNALLNVKHHREMSTSRLDKEFMKLNLSSSDQIQNDDRSSDRSSDRTDRSSDRTDRSNVSYPQSFRKGNPIQVEVARFGPLGASVEIVAKSHNPNDMIPENEPPLGLGLILQKEIGYFRAARGGVDVVVGEILPAYVDWVRDDEKVDISLRKPGGKGKAEDLGQIILAKMKESKNGEIEVGDKSSPDAINIVFPGASKASFKRAVAALYKKRLVQPGPHTTRLMD
jgi:hypothetical protein